MAQAILIPGLGASVTVDMWAGFYKGDVFHNAFYFEDSKRTIHLYPDTANDYYKLRFRAIISFPTHTWKMPGRADSSSTSYQMVVEGGFDNVLHDSGDLKSPVNEDELQPLNFRFAQSGASGIDSHMRYLGGKVRVVQSNIPDVYVVKAGLVVGTRDVAVSSWGETTQDSQWTVGNGGGDEEPKKKSGGPDKAGLPALIPPLVWVGKKLIDGVKVERTGEATSSTSGTQLTLTDTYGAGEWTLFIVRPAKKPVPKPPAPVKLPAHKVYFRNAKADLKAGNNNTADFPNKLDQIDALQKFIEGVHSTRGLNSILEVEVVGYASDAGDSSTNYRLSQQRAQYVKDEMVSRLSGRVAGLPPFKVYGKGDPGQGKRDNPEDRRVEVMATLKGR